MSDVPRAGVFLGMATLVIQNEGEPPKTIECPVYQVTDNEGNPLQAPAGAEN